MKPANKMFLALIVLALVFAVAAPRLLMAAEEKSVAIPDLADLIPLAAELSGRLAVLEKSVAVGMDLSAVEQSLSEIEADLQNDLVQLEWLEAAETSRYLQLVELEETVENEAAALEKVNNSLTGEIRKLGDLRKEWLAEKNRWNEWQSSLLEGEPLDKVKSTFTKAHQTMDTALNLIRQELEPLLTVQERAGNIRARIISLAAEIDGLILARGGVLLESSPPMFSSRYLAQFGSELWFGVHGGLAEVSLPRGRFFTRQGWIVFLQGLLTLALIIAIYRNRQVLQDSEHWQFVAERPFSAGLFLGVMTTLPFYEYGGMPATWDLAITMVGGIAVARLVGGLV